MEYKAAVIGDKESILGFSALGLTTCATDDPVVAALEIKRLCDSGCAVIFITEKLAREIPDCAVIPIPSKEGSFGIGEREMHEAVEKAVGADILKDKEN